MSVKLSVLIPCTPDRQPFIDKLLIQFREQLGLFGNYLDRKNSHIRIEMFHAAQVEIIYFEDDYKYSIGYKRNALLDYARGEYIVFIDSDDRIGPNYFKHAFEGISRGVDACGLTGIITENGLNPKKFVHSMQYDSWFEKDGIYYRNNNHLNVVRSDIAKRMKFPETNQGEDHDYSKQLLASGLIKTEYWDQDEVIYYYDYRSKK